ncbi:DUF7660 family protein [Pseudomonas fulva]|uniref:DUF7660 domain-containing protein n=1 Tax=Pseudomonas fulva (strain 12-X) TaxID=743720 RepID=F6AHP5_PSEF1|nr:hypothetical protein [Pseudomonas fulva]AEF21569.1 hypothetical protein Psefu_1595 [Pseudomonas fulva 12-X]
MANNMELHELLDRVEDSATFLEFARALEKDKAANSGEWQNTTIEDFLESAISWAQSSDFGLRQGLEPSNPWQQFAVFLYCGKIYE